MVGAEKAQSDLPKIYSTNCYRLTFGLHRVIQLK